MILFHANMTALVEYQKQIRFHNLNEKYNKSCKFQVLRKANSKLVSPEDFQVGDVLKV